MGTSSDEYVWDHNGWQHGDEPTLPTGISSEITTPRGSLSYKLIRVANKMNAQAAAVVELAAGVPLSHYRVLVFLRTLGPSSQSTLQAYSGMDKGFLSRTVSAMRDGGLVRAAHSPSTELLLEPTAEGHSVVRRVEPLMRRRLEALFAEFGGDEITRLDAMLSRLDRSAEQREFD